MQEIVNTLTTIYNNEIFQMIFKFVLITFFAGIIGIQREHSSKPAGFRTHVLVGISSVLVMVCGIELAKSFGSNDPSRMPAQLLSGIGFIGAGTILSNGFKVKGLTTAAGLLAITCIGLTVGAGMYLYATLATIIVYIILGYSRIFDTNYTHEVKFKVICDEPRQTLDVLNSVISKFNLDVAKIKVVEKDEENDISYILFEANVTSVKFDKNKFLTEFAKINEVKQVTEA